MKQERGASILEFCAILPLFIFLLCIMVDVLMLFYTQGELEYSATCCQNYLTETPPPDEKTRAQHVMTFIKHRKLAPSGLTLAFSPDDMQGILSVDHMPLTPLVEKIMPLPLKLNARFMIQKSSARPQLR